jgi:hypothetical protein
VDYAAALAFPPQAVVRVGEFRATEVIDAVQQSIHVGPRRIYALVEVGHSVVIDREAPALQSVVGFYVDIRDEIGARNGLDQQEELLGAVYVDFFMEGTRLAPLSQGVDVHVRREPVVERLQTELELRSICHGELRLRGEMLAIASRNRRCSWAVYHLSFWVLRMEVVRCGSRWADRACPATARAKV